jgi:hypothetical protein
VDKYWRSLCLFLGVLLDARDSTLLSGVIISWDLSSHILSQEDEAVNVASQGMNVSKQVESINNGATQMAISLMMIKKHLCSVQKKQKFTEDPVQTLQGQEKKLHKQELTLKSKAKVLVKAFQHIFTIHLYVFICC